VELNICWEWFNPIEPAQTVHRTRLGGSRMIVTNCEMRGSYVRTKPGNDLSNKSWSLDFTVRSTTAASLPKRAD